MRSAILLNKRLMNRGVKMAATSSHGSAIAAGSMLATALDNSREASQP